MAESNALGCGPLPDRPNSEQKRKGRTACPQSAPLTYWAVAVAQAW